MPVHAIAYASQAVPGLSAGEVEGIVHDAASHNLMAGVTGVLLYDGSRFLQYIEGPADGVASAYGRIRNATSHMEMMELGRGMTGSRRFPYWSMHCIPVESEELVEAIRAEWAALGPSPAVTRASLSGVDRVAALVAPHVNH
ncbi:BLUF domain-containing protein [Stenotrophomonas sp.]|uniref:BLUF domain-containing protein n=1 Tax=Stenotrophomonas sp. TaxID=69392 RepID=UPI0028981F24|nr:BLUF domain-containing protein [Stenotrophomonas sp.]